ncbi:MAG: hypothetical protein ACK56I_22760, partial [bacterium]
MFAGINLGVVFGWTIAHGRHQLLSPSQPLRIRNPIAHRQPLLDHLQFGCRLELHRPIDLLRYRDQPGGIVVDRRLFLRWGQKIVASPDIAATTMRHQHQRRFGGRPLFREVLLHGVAVAAEGVGTDRSIAKIMHREVRNQGQGLATFAGAETDHTQLRVFGAGWT